MKKHLNDFKNKFTSFFEVIFVLISAIVLLIFTGHSIYFLYHLDWSSADSFQLFIQRMLLLFVGLELLQLARNQNLKDMFLIIIFVVARKALEPLVSPGDLLFLVISLVVLIITWTFIHRRKEIVIEEPS